MEALSGEEERQLDEDLHDACKRASEAIRGADIRTRWSISETILAPLLPDPALAVRRSVVGHGRGYVGRQWYVVPPTRRKLH
jgi:hypothetical protein